MSEGKIKISNKEYIIALKKLIYELRELFKASPILGDNNPELKPKVMALTDEFQKLECDENYQNLYEQCNFGVSGGLLPRQWF